MCTVKIVRALGETAAKRLEDLGEGITVADIPRRIFEELYSFG